jgi:hypothetical protein
MLEISIFPPFSNKMTWTIWLSYNDIVFNKISIFYTGYLSGDILDKNIGKFLKEPNEEQLAINMRSDRIRDNGDIHQIWMVIY